MKKMKTYVTSFVDHLIAKVTNTALAVHGQPKFIDEKNSSNKQK